MKEGKRLVMLLQSLRIITGVGLIVALVFLKISMPDISHPRMILGVMILCFADLLLRTPLIAAQSAVCARLAKSDTEYRKAALNAFTTHSLRKALCLRMALWWKRLWRYGAVFFFAALLLAVSGQLRDRPAYAVDAQILGLFSLTLSYGVLIVGVILVEVDMLHYMAAWHGLSQCDEAKQALQYAKSVSFCRLNDIVWLNFRFLRIRIWGVLLLPAVVCETIFEMARAEWIENQTATAKHVHISKKNVKTFKGITRCQKNDNGRKTK